MVETVVFEIIERGVGRLLNKLSDSGDPLALIR